MIWFSQGSPDNIVLVFLYGVQNLYLFMTTAPSKLECRVIQVDEDLVAILYCFPLYGLSTIL
jgi:hypothetical protein